MIRHVLSATSVERVSIYCRGGHMFQADTPAECLVAMPEGCDSFCVERPRIDLCADCDVTRRAGQCNTPLRTAAEAAVDRDDPECGHD
jgi:hypothetical protein